MTFDWDEANIEHLGRHGEPPEKVESLLNRDAMEVSFEWEDDEFRFRVAGETGRGRILELVSTERGESTRVISGWDAPRDIRLKYLIWRTEAYAR